MAKSVNIITVNFNQLVYLKYCIDYLYNNTEYPFHYTIVDQNSNDGSREWLIENQKKLGFDIVLFNRNTGVAFAHNYVWRAYPEEHYLKLDPDTLVLNKGWLKTLVKISEENPDVVGAMGLNVEPINYEPSILSGENVQFKNGNLGGACCFIPISTWRDLGYWDYWGQLYGEEDALMGTRVILLGKKNIYLSDYKAVHLPSFNYCNVSKEQEFCKFKDECRKENLLPDSEYKKREREYNSKTRSLKIS